MRYNFIVPFQYLRRLILGNPSDRDESRPNRLRAQKACAPELEAFVGPDPSSPLPTISAHAIFDWAQSLFPFTKWLFNYRREWIAGDLVAGLTVGLVVIPQGMAYAKLAELPVEFGLYGSFMSVLIYWLFATSKDITIGPVAVMSQLTGTIVRQAAVTLPDVPGHVVASALAFVCGCVICAMGFLRLGFVVEFIPLPAIAAFMTSSAISIIAGQVPTMLGISRRLDTRGPTYKVIIHTLQMLLHTSTEAAIGLTALAMLCALRFGLPHLRRRRGMSDQRVDVLVSLRSIVVLLLYTLLSYLLTRHRPQSPPISILGHIPRGLTALGPPQLERQLITAFAPSLPAALIVLVIEHISIAKSFARINRYTISPSQELIAIGVSNIFGPFVGAYPATGSFSRTALKAKCGVRTPLAGIVTGILVLVSIYALTGVFYYIPNAAISAVIVHAVADLILWPSKAYRTLWRVSAWDGLIFFAGVLMGVFTTIEVGIYTTVIASLAKLLFMLTHTHIQTLGTATVRSYQDGSGTNPELIWISTTGADGTNPALVTPFTKVLVARLTGPLFYASSSSLTSQLSAHSPTGIVLDLSATATIDSTAVEALMRLQEELVLPIVFCGIRSASVLEALGARGFGGSGLEPSGCLVGPRGRIASETTPSGGEERSRKLDVDEHVGNENWVVPLLAIDRPFFQIDVPHAVEYLCKLMDKMEAERNSKNLPV